MFAQSNRSKILSVYKTLDLLNAADSVATMGSMKTAEDGTAPGYYHMYANGDDAKEFVICEDDYKFQFNLVGVCAYNSGAEVLAFSIEDSHPHIFLFGTMEQCLKFKRMYESATRHHITSTRGQMDGKFVMPYDYRWGTGSLYFRPQDHIPIWYKDKGIFQEPVSIGSLSAAKRQKIRGSRLPVPDEWLVCHGLILPCNYLNVNMFEGLYKTPNCFRAFLSSGKAKDTPILERMAASRGVSLEGGCQSEVYGLKLTGRGI